MKKLVKGRRLKIRLAISRSEREVLVSVSILVRSGPHLGFEGRVQGSKVELAGQGRI